MKISIITVSYNSSLTIRDTIESVLSQTYEDIEYIVVDGNSEDNTVDIINEYVPHFNGRLRWISEPDSGLYYAMNKGIEMTTGEVVSILNSDDLFFDNSSVDQIMSIFQNNQLVDALYADLLYVKRNDLSSIVRKWVVGKQRSFASGWDVAHPTFYVRKKIYDKYGLFDLTYKLSADFEIIIRFMEVYKINIFYLNRFLVKMRLGGETSKNINNFILQNAECIKAFKKHNIDVNTFRYFFLRLAPKVLQYIR